MSSGATAFNSEDLELLLQRYETPATENEPRRPPWTWSALNHKERTALARMIDTWIDTYNHVHAITPQELIPPCWLQHPALAAELAVHVWLWYYAHLDPNITPPIAGDYYLRHLPNFRNRIDRLLGISPGECRRGQHPDTWRSEADQQIATHLDIAAPTDNPAQVELLGALHFGFPHLNDHGQA